MKIILSGILALTSVIVSALEAKAALGVAHVQTRTTETCGDPTLAVPFYRVYGATVGKQIYCMNPAIVTNELHASAVWAFQGLTAFVFATQEESTVPLNHMVNAATGDRIYTTNSTEVGVLEKSGYGAAVLEPVYYIYPTQICDSVPLYRLFNSRLNTHFYTASETERIESIQSQGYADQGIAGYVFAPEPTQC